MDAFRMATHPRLGRESGANTLMDDVMAVIYDILLDDMRRAPRPPAPVLLSFSEIEYRRAIARQAGRRPRC